MSQSGFFTTPLSSADPEVFNAIELELGRQRHEIELIASENIVSRAVTGSAGLGADQQICRGLSRQALLRRLPVRRHRREARDRPRQEALRLRLRQCAAELRLARPIRRCSWRSLQPGDTFMGLDLAAGGHLTHGSPVNCPASGSSRSPTACARTTTASTWSKVAKLAEEHKPKLIIAGGSAYSRIWDFAGFREIADEVGAYFMVDMAHFAGLVAAGAASLARSRTPMSSRRRRTRRCAVRAAAWC